MSKYNRSKSVAVIIVRDGIPIALYASVKECARQLGVDDSNIHKCLRNDSRKLKGYTFVKASKC